MAYRRIQEVRVEAFNQIVTSLEAEGWRVVPGTSVVDLKSNSQPVHYIDMVREEVLDKESAPTMLWQGTKEEYESNMDIRVMLLHGWKISQHSTVPAGTDGKLVITLVFEYAP